MTKDPHTVYRPHCSGNGAFCRVGVFNPPVK